MYIYTLDQVHYRFFKVKSDSFGLLKSYMLLFYLPSSTAFTSHSFPYKITLHFLQSGQLYSAILLCPLCTFFYIYIYPLFLTAPFFHCQWKSIFSSLLPSNSLSCQWYSFTISASFTVLLSRFL